ncbi:MAG TPA: potassium transporter [Chloroflexi bacterium]|nr:potassium transporter [Chloroflexota bacterium]
MSTLPPDARSPGKAPWSLPAWLSSSTPPSRRRLARARQPAAQRALTILAGLVILIVVGALVLWMPISSTRAQGLAFHQALFTTVSAVTGTGLSIITPSTDLSLFGQIVLMALMQIGGLGFVMTAIIIFRLLGRRVTLAERLTLRDSLGLTNTRDLVKLSLLVLLGIMIIELVGALLLWMLWAGRFPFWTAGYYALFHAVAAFTNAGFDLFSGSPFVPDGPPQDIPTLMVVGALIFLGSIGLPVVSDILQWRRRRRLSLHSRVTLWTSGGLIAFGAIAFFIGEMGPDSRFATAPRLDLLAGSIYFSVATRSAGLVLHPSYVNLSQANIIVASVLMFVGASPSGMGGGITTSTLAVQLLSVWNYARGRNNLRAGRRVIPEEALRKASIVITTSFLINFLVTWLLLLTQEATFQEALFESVSAFGTVGFSLGLTGRLDLFGQALLMLLMFWGRLGALTIIVALAQPRLPERVGYPEESILL